MIWATYRHRKCVYLYDDIDVRGQEADKDSKLELGEDQLPADPDPSTQLQDPAHPPANSVISLVDLRDPVDLRDSEDPNLIAGS